MPMPATFAHRFLLEEAVSVGHPTFVWRAQEMANRRRVALTFFPAAWLDTPRGLAGAEELIAAMKDLGHPGVVVPTEVVPGHPWSAFVSPWVDGPTLHQMRAGRPTRRFEVDEFRPWLRTLMAALEAVHARGFVHGGLDPGLVIQRGASLCIVNTGVCAWLDRAAERNRVDSRYRSDWPYRSPSRRRGDPPGAADDIYALGAMLFEQLTGTCPEPGRRWAGRAPKPGFVQRERRRTGSPGQDVPVSWERAIWRSLAPHDRNRLASVGEFRVRLDLAAPDRAPARAPSSAPPGAGHSAGVRTVASLHAPPPVREVPGRTRVGGIWGLRCMVAVIALATVAVAGAFVWQLMAQRPADPPVSAAPAGWPDR